MSTESNIHYATYTTWTCSGACVDNGADAERHNRQVACVGDVLLADVFDEVTLLGRNPEDSVTIRKGDGDIIDCTTGHLRRKRYAFDEPPHVVPVFAVGANGAAELVGMEFDAGGSKYRAPDKVAEAK
eukprot:6200340-Pleurochrysis_carterae.AAC.1